jgi:hypothetical protein
MASQAEVCTTFVPHNVALGHQIRTVPFRLSLLFCDSPCTYFFTNSGSASSLNVNDIHYSQWN